MKDFYMAQHINTNISIDRYLTDRQILKICGYACCVCMVECLRMIQSINAVIFIAEGYSNFPSLHIFDSRWLCLKTTGR